MLFVVAYISNKMLLLMAVPRLTGIKAHLFEMCGANLMPCFASFNQTDASIGCAHTSLGLAGV